MAACFPSANLARTFLCSTIPSTILPPTRKSLCPSTATKSVGLSASSTASFPASRKPASADRKKTMGPRSDNRLLYYIINLQNDQVLFIPLCNRCAEGIEALGQAGGEG